MATLYTNDKKLSLIGFYKLLQSQQLFKFKLSHVANSEQICRCIECTAFTNRQFFNHDRMKSSVVCRVVDHGLATKQN